MLKPEAPPPGDPLAEDPDGKVNRPGPDRTCHSENRHETNTVTIAQATARWHLRWAWCSSKCLAWVTPLALPTGLGADRIVTHSLRLGGARISWRPEVRAQWQPLTSGVHRCPLSLAQIHGLTGKVRPEAQVSRRGSPCMAGGCQARTRGGTCPAVHRPRSERWLCHPRLGDSAQ